MAFEEYKYLSANRDFILSCPLPAPVELNFKLISETGLDYEEIEATFGGSDVDGAGAAIIGRGNELINERRTVTGRSIQSRRFLSAIRFWRSSIENEFRRDIINYLNQLINWINDENSRRYKATANPALPHFSMTRIESITASGGARTAIIDNVRSEYEFQIANNFQLIL